MSRFFVDGKSYTTAELIESFQSPAQEWMRSIVEFIRRWHSGQQDFVVHTSGSTGAPKPISLSRNTMMASARNTAQFLDLPAGSRAVLHLSASRIAGKMMIVRAIENGWDLELNAPSVLPQTSLDADFTAMVPMQVQSLLDECPEQVLKYTKIIIGGAPLSPQLEDRLVGLYTRCFVTYGMTETASHVAMREVGQQNYVALPGISFTLNDDECLVVHADYLETDLETHDVVELVSESSFRWLGRKDDVINSGGVKIHPTLVEAEIAPLLESRRFFVAGKIDPLLGERVVLVIEGESFSAEEENALLEEVRKRIHRFEIPKEVLYCDTIETTVNGKIKRILPL